MPNKEFKVGETFQCGLVKIRVVKGDDSCRNCFFNESYLCGNLNKLTGSCFSSEREDNTDVIFVKVEDIEE